MSRVPSALRRRPAVFACVAAALLAAPAAASAAPVPAELRVEADGQALVPGYSYFTDSETVTADRSCGGSGRTLTLNGPNATGILATAAESEPRVRPVGVSDAFSFGLFVCRVGAFAGNSTDRFWLFKVNHVSPTVGGEQVRLRQGDEVLWFLQDFGKSRNTGDELDLEAPARVQTGTTFQVEVVAYDAAGKRSPAAGATVYFPGGQATAGKDGRASLRITDPGTARLRAGRASDVPSGVEPVCVSDSPLRRCASRVGERIYGTDAAERIKGTAGRDVIKARGGNDRIVVTGGSRDRVNCGRGRDRVRADRRDRVSRNCERVRRRR